MGISSKVHTARCDGSVDIVEVVATIITKVMFDLIDGRHIWEKRSGLGRGTVYMIVHLALCT